MHGWTEYANWISCHYQELYLNVKSCDASINPKSDWGEKMIRKYAFDVASNDITQGEMI